MHDVNWLMLGIGIGMLVGYYSRMGYEWAKRGEAK